MSPDGLNEGRNGPPGRRLPAGKPGSSSHSHEPYQEDAQIVHRRTLSTADRGRKDRTLSLTRPWRETNKEPANYQLRHLADSGVRVQ